MCNTSLTIYTIVLSVTEELISVYIVLLVWNKYVLDKYNNDATSQYFINAVKQLTCHFEILYLCIICVYIQYIYACVYGGMSSQSLSADIYIINNVNNIT